MKTYVIGDIHGCYKTLKELYSRLEPNSRIISVGDLVDKGPSSMDVVNFCIEKNIEVIKGNHEQLFIKFVSDYLKTKRVKLTRWYTEWGGDTTMESYKRKKKVMIEHLEYFKTLPLYKEVEVNGRKFFITHGFALPYYDKKDTEESHIPFMSNRLYGHYFNINNIDTLEHFGVINVFGHDSFVEVKKHKLYYGIDTGCVYNKTIRTAGKLTALDLETLETISVDVIDEVNYNNMYYN